ncbi:hypothetical protein PNOK_0937900 [Pyrrhoderma noxium]|uniref:Uncharacterized protein n=1 Tax=Pyrrhoderma noxium TaxID=2282107 RepID=A0A286U5G1_9AGAM|nr:hypothetical protein PNOK_0937900 [Pyrrhoderma noxium]
MGSLKFDSLPEDVLIQILLYKPKFEWPEKEWNSEWRTLLSISHTNRALRRLVLSTPCLWSTLTIEIGLLMYYVKGDKDSRERAMRARNEGVLILFRLWIERSGEVPLNYKIDICGNTPAANDLINLFFEQKYRWRSAKVSFSRRPLRIPSSGLKNMPCLQNLSITGLNADFQLETDIDLSESTQLRNLCLKWVNSSLWRTVMDTIHTQQLTELQLVLAPDGHTRDISGPYILTSLSSFTNLKRLYIDSRPGYFNSHEVWNGPPVLLPNLRVLILYEFREEILEHFNTPSLVSLFLHIKGDEEHHILNFIRRSSPPLETMHISVYRLEGDDFLRILEEVPTVKTLSLRHTLSDRRNNKLHDFWSFLSINDSSMDVLLPELTELYFHTVQFLRNILKAFDFMESLKTFPTETV